MLFPKAKAQALAGLLLLAAAGSAVAADPQSAAEAFRKLNDTAASIYRDAKERYREAADPVVIVSFDSVVLRQNGAERRVGQMPASVDVLKSASHAPRSLWAALRPAIDGLDKTEAWRGKLAALRPRLEAALNELPEAGLSTAAADRDGRMLRACIGLIDRYLAKGPPPLDQLQHEMRAFAPTLLADAAEAARLRLDALDRDMRPWWNGLSQAERDRTLVVVLGGKTARPGNMAYSYFINLLGEAEDGHRLIYAESIFDRDGAEQLLTSLLTDRRLSADLFADERRMERDLLADGAAARLLEMFGRLGAP